MKSYVEKVLVEGEQLLYRGHPSLWAYFWNLFFAALLFLGGIILAVANSLWLVLMLSAMGGVLFLIAYVNYKSTELAITSKRIIVKFGFIRRDTTEINLTKVESVQVQQSFTGRLLNFGTIAVSAGGGAMAPVPHIHAPLEFRKQFILATDQRQT